MFSWGSAKWYGIHVSNHKQAHHSILATGEHCLFYKVNKESLKEALKVSCDSCLLQVLHCWFVCCWNLSSCSILPVTLLWLANGIVDSQRNHNLERDFMAKFRIKEVFSVWLFSGHFKALDFISLTLQSTSVV